MRLSRNAVSSRELFVSEQVRLNPKITGYALNELLFARDGKRMAVNRLYELKRLALNGGAAALVAEPAVLAAKVIEGTNLEICVDGEVLHAVNCQNTIDF
jgi:hypothetical protein